MRPIYLAAIAAACALGIASAAHADGIGDAIGDYIIQKYNPKKTLIIGTKQAFGSNFSGGLAGRLEDKGRDFAIESFDEGVRRESVAAALDYLMQAGPYDLAYCTIGVRECDVAQAYIEKKGYKGPFLQILLNER